MIFTADTDGELKIDREEFYSPEDLLTRGLNIEYNSVINSDVQLLP